MASRFPRKPRSAAMAATVGSVDHVSMVRPVRGKSLRIRGVCVVASAPVIGAKDLTRAMLLVTQPASLSVHADAVYELTRDRGGRRALLPVVEKNAADAETQRAARAVAMAEAQAAGRSADPKTYKAVKLDAVDGCEYAVSAGTLLQLVWTATKTAAPPSMDVGTVYEVAASGIERKQRTIVAGRPAVIVTYEPRVTEIAYVKNQAALTVDEAGWQLLCMHMACQLPVRLTPLAYAHPQPSMTADALKQLKGPAPFSDGTCHMRTAPFFLPLGHPFSELADALIRRGEHRVTIYGNPHFSNEPVPAWPHIDSVAKGDARKCLYKSVHVMVTATQYTRKADGSDGVLSLDPALTTPELLRLHYQPPVKVNLAITLYESALRQYGIMNEAQYLTVLPVMVLHTPAMINCYVKPTTTTVLAHELPVGVAQDSTSLPVIEFVSAGTKESKGASALVALAVGIANAGFEVTQSGACELLTARNESLARAVSKRVAKPGEVPVTQLCVYSPNMASVLEDGRQMRNPEDAAPHDIPKNPVNAIGSPVINLMESRENVTAMRDSEWVFVAVPTFGVKSEDDEGLLSQSLTHYQTLAAESIDHYEQRQAQLAALKAQFATLGAGEARLALKRDIDDLQMLIGAESAWPMHECATAMGRLLVTKIRTGHLTPHEVDDAFAYMEIEPGRAPEADLVLWAVRREYFDERGLGLATTTSLNDFNESLLPHFLEQLFPADLSDMRNDAQHAAQLAAQQALDDAEASAADCVEAATIAAAAPAAVGEKRPVADAAAPPRKRRPAAADGDASDQSGDGGDDSSSDSATAPVAGSVEDASATQGTVPVY